MFVCLSRRNRTETAVDDDDDDAVFMFVSVESSFKTRFELLQNDERCVKFSSVWCYKHVFCCVVDDQLFFGRD